MRWLDLLVILLYFVAVGFIGWRFARRQHSTETYFVARRAVPHWAMGLSLFATIISSVTFIAYPGSAYAGNWNELVPGFMIIAVLLLVGWVIIPFFRRAVGMSAYEYFGHRFGYSARAYSALAFTAGHFSKMGFVYYLLALTVTSMTGWNIYLVLAITGLVTIGYTLLGGLEAVVWTEVVQGIVLVSGIVVVVWILFDIMPGGATAAFQLASDKGKFSLGNLGLNLLEKNSILVMSLYGFFWYLQKYAADQTLVQRYLIAKSDKDALKGIVLGAILCLPVWTAFMLVGTMVWCYYQLSNEPLPAHLFDAAGKVAADKVFPYFLTTRVPPGLAGIFMAALFSAGMSTISADLNCLSAVGVEDYYRKLRPQASDQKRLAMGKLLVAGCGLAALGIAMVIASRGERALSLYYAACSIISGGLAGLFLLAFFSRRANQRGLWIGICANLLFTAWAVLTSGKNKMLDLGSYNYVGPSVMIGVIGHVLVLVVGYFASLAFASQPESNKQWTLWGWLEHRKTLKEENSKFQPPNSKEIPNSKLQ